MREIQLKRFFRKVDVVWKWFLLVGLDLQRSDHLIEAYRHGMLGKVVHHVSAADCHALGYLLVFGNEDDVVGTLVFVNAQHLILNLIQIYLPDLIQLLLHPDSQLDPFRLVRPEAGLLEQRGCLVVNFLR